MRRTWALKHQPTRAEDVRQTQEGEHGNRTDTRSGWSRERNAAPATRQSESEHLSPGPGGQRIEDGHLDPGENVAPNTSAVSRIARNTDAPSRYRLRNANPASISYGAAQGQGHTLNDPPA